MIIMTKNEITSYFINIKKKIDNNKRIIEKLKKQIDNKNKIIKKYQIFFNKKIEDEINNNYETECSNETEYSNETDCSNEIECSNETECSNEIECSNIKKCNRKLFHFF